MTHELQIKGLEVSIAGKKILRGVDLTVRQGEVHAIMGPNGSGKTSLAYALMGHPDYHVDAGSVTWRGEPILGLAPDVRARLGIFLAFQYPSAIPGVTVASFLRNIYNAVHHPKPVGDDGQAATRYTGIPLAKFRKLLEEKMSLLRMDPSFATRYVNEGFSGGEKKRNEIFQMALLDPELAILDETDSGLDIDALRIVAGGVNQLRSPSRSMIVVTHYQRLLNYIVPDFLHVLVDGRVVRSGGKELALELEEKGYAWLEKEPPAPRPAGRPQGVVGVAE